MENEIYVTQKLIRKMYNELSEEIKKDKYKNTYAWYDWNPIVLSNDIENSAKFSQEESFISYSEKIYGIEYGTVINENKKGSKYIVIFYEDYDERFFKLDDIKKVMHEIVDFNKLEKLEDDGEIYIITLKELLDKNIILNKDKFLKIYCKANKVCLLKDLNLKKIDIYQLLNLYDELIKEDNSFCSVFYLDDIKQDDSVNKHL